MRKNKKLNRPILRCPTCDELLAAWRDRLLCPNRCDFRIVGPTASHVEALVAECEKEGRFFWADEGPEWCRW